MSGSTLSVTYPARLISGFISGFLGTMIFHQLMLAFLWAIGVAPFAPFPMAPTHPFGVPTVISLAFWGGIWGIVFVMIEGGFPRGAGYWVTAFLFGAILPSLVALIVVLPMKGRPMGGGWHLSLLISAFLINGAWGVGTGIFFEGWRRWLRASESRPASP